MWNERTKNFPEVIYIQIDGASENANKALIGMLELMVHKGMAREIHLNRVPTGHTHDDIDGIFGVVWSHMENKCSETIDQYKNILVEGFIKSKSSHSAVVVEVNAILDYAKIIKPHIDPTFANFAREENTQHSWLFQHVDKSIDFPLGIKTMYRAYSSDRVVEFIEKPKSECVTPIGKLIVLDPVTVNCRWYPHGSTFDTRKDIEGFYLLSNIPELGNTTNFPWKAFEPGSIDGFERTYMEACKTWPQDSTQFISWTS